MGDVVQTLPAITDAQNTNADLSVDWVIDQAFAEIPAWHPSVTNVIASPPRRLSNLRTPPFQTFLERLKATPYDVVVDLQGHWKSSVLAKRAKGIHSGYAADSVNEWGAHLFYKKKYSVPKNLHSTARMRRLMALALNYAIPAGLVDYRIDRSRLPGNPLEVTDPYIVMIHSTSWESKNWPEDRWKALREEAVHAGFYVVLPWGNELEKKRGERIAANDPKTVVLPKLSISQKAAVLAGAAGTVGLDTGLSHIAAALDVPSVTLYGATDPLLTGAVGKNQVHIVSDFECVKCHRSVCNYRKRDVTKPACLDGITADSVWQKLCALMVRSSQSSGAINRAPTNA